MGLTKIANKLFSSRQKELDKHYTNPEAIQQNVLKYLLGKGRDTEYGRSHLFSGISTYTDFSKGVPINTYEELKVDIDRMRRTFSGRDW